MNKGKEALIMRYEINKHGYLLKCKKLCVYIVNLKVNRCNYISCHIVWQEMKNYYTKTKLLFQLNTAVFFTGM